MGGRAPFIGAVRGRALGLFVLAVAVAAGSVTLLRRPAAIPGRPDARARLQGGPLAPNLAGEVRFYGVAGGVEVAVELHGLPPYLAGDPPIGPHGFHLHERGDCAVGNPGEPFLAAGAHFNPDGQPHGNHAGDFPVVFSNSGTARMRFFTERLTIEDVVGRSVIVHENPDDFRTEPAGNSGRRLACGVVVRP